MEMTICCLPTVFPTSLAGRLAHLRTIGVTNLVRARRRAILDSLPVLWLEERAVVGAGRRTSSLPEPPLPRPRDRIRRTRHDTWAQAGRVDGRTRLD
jgi:hypothetical protein